MPGGFYALARMYKNSQKEDDDENPFEEINMRTKIQEEREAARALREGRPIKEEENTMTNDPMPNPWAPRLPMLLAITDGMSDDETFITEQLAQLAELETRVAVNNEATVSMSRTLNDRSKRIFESNKHLKKFRESLLSETASKRESAYKLDIMKKKIKHMPSPPGFPKPPKTRRGCIDSHFKKLADLAMKTEQDMMQEIDPGLDFPEEPLEQFVLSDPQNKLCQQLDESMDIAKMQSVLKNLGEIALRKLKDLQNENCENDVSMKCNEDMDTHCNTIPDQIASTSKHMDHMLPSSKCLQNEEDQYKSDIWMEDKSYNPYGISHGIENNINRGISADQGMIVDDEDMYVSVYLLITPF